MHFFFFSNKYINYVLSHANKDELVAIGDLIIGDHCHIPTDISRDEITVKDLYTLAISQLGQNSILRRLRRGNEPVGYLSILLKLEKALDLGDVAQIPAGFGVDDSSSGSEIAKRFAYCAIEDVEDAILKKIASLIYGKMSAAQKQQFIELLSRQLNQQQTHDVAKSLGMGGILLAGNLGGFATYTALSSLLHVLSIGTLGFGAYTAASTALSFVLGPAGWAAFGAFLAYSLSSPDLKKLAMIVCAIALIRHRNDLHFYERDTTYGRK